ncbi:hypothetical protein [Luteibacter sahnii]|uniref:hypothetical protein n=1 Tax=Luteibacter sahnii TaxID=3021977 RepID=UPI002A6B5C14|nr:hypothetical protein [Luteibacter sp. PPL193]MDY1548546.1 hypothetical protein [Luteibacter sp. PPL193]
MSDDAYVWWKVVATSAVASTIVNFIANAAIKRWDNWREDKKETARRDVVYLDIALQLEDFAFRAANLIEGIKDGIAQYRAEQDDRHLQALQEIAFNFDASTEWDRVPAEVAVRAKTFPRNLERSRDFIFFAWRHWAELDDAWEYDAERLAFYGLGAIKFAADIRREMKVNDDHFVLKLAKIFEDHIDARRQFFVQSRSEDSVIPELAEQFKKEGLSVLPSSPL